MAVGESWKTCPFPAVLVGYVVIIFVCACLMAFIPRLESLALPVVGTLLATGAVGLAVEVRRRKPNECPWLDFGDARRAVMYLSLFFVGISVVLPGLYPSRAIEWPLRIPFVLFAIAGIALLRIHRSVDHGTLEEAGVSRGIYVASRLPLYILSAIAVFVVIAGILALAGLGRCVSRPPNPRLQRTRVRPSGGRSPLSRKPFGDLVAWKGVDLAKALTAVLLLLGLYGCSYGKSVPAVLAGRRFPCRDAIGLGRGITPADTRDLLGEPLDVRSEGDLEAWHYARRASDTATTLGFLA